jgi:serine phosphatase RsbU (regulator of sigma subunit)
MADATPTQPSAVGPSAEAALDGLLDAADIGLALLDSDLQVVRVNAAFVRLAQASGDRVGRHASELLPDLPPHALAAIARPLETGEAVRELELSEEGHSLAGRTFICGSLPVRVEGRVAAVWWSLREVTADRRERAAGKRHASDLERELREEHRIAEQLGVSLLPDRLPDVPGAEIASGFHPASDTHGIGGDFYDVFRVGKPHCWMVVVGDVCGKGAEAASLTALARYTLRAAAIQEGAEPAILLEQLNEALCFQRGDDRFVTAVCAFVDTDDDGPLRVTVSVAGHPPPLILRADGAIERLTTSGALLGVWDDPGLSETSAELGRGDRLVLYTDGVLEAHAPDGPFEEGFERALAELPAQSSAETIGSLHTVLDLGGDGAARDDIAVLVVQPDPR